MSPEVNANDYFHISGIVIVCLDLDFLVPLRNQIRTTHLPLGQEPLAIQHQW